MNTKTAQQIAIAFKRGLAFIRGITRMAQDADPDEKWITIGAEEGDDGKRHGGRPVCISKSTGKIIKGLSKDVVGMTLNEAFKELKKTPEEKEAGNLKKHTEKMANGIAEYTRSAKEGASKLRKTISKLKGLRSTAKANNQSWDLNRLIKIYEKRANEWENSDIDKKINTGAEIIAKEHNLTDPSVKERILNYETEKLNNDIQNLSEQADKFLAKMQELKKPTRVIYNPTTKTDIAEEVKPGESVKQDAKGTALIQEMQGIKSEEYRPIVGRIENIVRRLNPDDRYTERAINGLYDAYNVMKNTDSDKLSGNKAARESDIKRWIATGENAGIITELERYTKDPKKYLDQAVELEKTNRAKVKEISDALKDLEKMPRDRKTRRLIANLRYAEDLAYQLERNQSDLRQYGGAPLKAEGKESFIHPLGLNLSQAEAERGWTDELLESYRKIKQTQGATDSSARVTDRVFMTQDAIPEELIRYSTRWVTIGRGARIMVDSNGTIRAGLGGKYNGRQFADVFKSREITGEKAALEKPEEQIEEMTEEQHAGEVNGAGVLDRLINGVSVWP